jgi:hypothetical protein
MQLKRLLGWGFPGQLFSHNVHNFTLSRAWFLPPLERVLLGFTHMFRKAFIVGMHLRADLWLQMWDLPVDAKYDADRFIMENGTHIDGIIPIWLIITNVMKLHMDGTCGQLQSIFSN